MKTQNLHYSNFNKIIVLLSFLVFFVNCAEKKAKQKEFKVLDFIHSFVDKEQLKNINTVFILSEFGCYGCNETFSRLIKSQINRKNAFIIINASGSNIDISDYLDENVNNVKVNIPPNKNVQTMCIFFKNCSIDTVVNITATNLLETLQYIQNS